MRVLFDDRQKTINDITLCFGGMAPTIVVATKTARELIGRSDDISRNIIAPMIYWMIHD